MLRWVMGKLQQVLTQGNIILNKTTGSVTVNDVPVSLSQARTALLPAFTRHPNQVLAAASWLTSPSITITKGSTGP